MVRVRPNNPPVEDCLAINQASQINNNKVEGYSGPKIRNNHLEDFSATKLLLNRNLEVFLATQQPISLNKTSNNHPLVVFLVIHPQTSLPVDCLEILLLNLLQVAYLAIPKLNHSLKPQQDYSETQPPISHPPAGYSETLLDNRPLVVCSEEGLLKRTLLLLEDCLEITPLNRHPHYSEEPPKATQVDCLETQRANLLQEVCLGEEVPLPAYLETQVNLREGYLEMPQAIVMLFFCNFRWI